MAAHNPRTDLATHDVFNQPPPLEDYNLCRSDPALVEALTREGAAAHAGAVDAYGAELGLSETLEHGRLANVFPPVLKTHDRYGQRVDEAEFHPGYHALMALGMKHGQHSIASGGQARRSRGSRGHAVHDVSGGGGGLLPADHDLRRETRPAAPAGGDGLLAGRCDEPVLRQPLHPRRAEVGTDHGHGDDGEAGGSDIRANTTRAVARGRQGPGRDL